MISQETIEEVKNRLVKVYDPIAIYLFGSYAWGTPNKDSDLDLLIVVDKSDERSFDRVRIGFDVLWGLDIAKDLIVYTKEEFDVLSQRVPSLAYKIKKEGKQVYARA